MLFDDPMYKVILDMLDLLIEGGKSNEMRIAALREFRHRTMHTAAFQLYPVRGYQVDELVSACLSDYIRKTPQKLSYEDRTILGDGREETAKGKAAKK